MRPADKTRQFIKNASINSNPEINEAVLKELLNELDKSKSMPCAARQPNIWRTIMKSRITKLTAAGVIIIAILIGVHYLGGSIESVAIADIVQPFLTARTATFKITIGGQGVPSQEFDGMFMEPCRMRQSTPGGGTVIVDLEQGKIVTLIPQAKQAVVLEVTNAPEDPGDLNFFQYIRMRILNAHPLDDESVEFLGEQQIDIDERRRLRRLFRGRLAELRVFGDRL